MKNILEWLKNLFKQPEYQRPENTGVILEPLKPEDYVAGVTSPIVYQTRIVNGNWTPYAWDEENQFSSRGDALDCVAESFINAVEAQEFFMTGRKVNYSKRWLAKCSGTNQGVYKGKGNTYANVADWIHNRGLVLESSYPKPSGWTVDEFYAEINPDLQTKLLAEGQIWLQKWAYDYEYLKVSDPNLDYHLKHSPINIVIPGHSVCGIYSPDQLMRYLDSYPNPYFKSAPVSGLQVAMKGILTSKLIQARQVGWQGSPELGIYIPADNMERFKFIQDNLPNWIPNYQLDVSKIYVLPTKKPF